MAKWGEGDPRWIVEERPDATNVNNWHWTEKNATSWSKDRLQKLFEGLNINDDNIECTITDIAVEGEAVVNNRKGKLIFFYEWNIILEWKGKLYNGDEEYVGKIIIPNLSEENDLDDIDITLSGDMDFSVEDINSLFYNKWKKSVKDKLATYLSELKEEYSRDLILPVKNTEESSPRKVAQYKSVCNDTLNADKNQPIPDQSKMKYKIDVETIEVFTEFQCQARELFDVLTKAELVSVFTNSPANMDVRVSGEYKLFGGNISGKFLEIIPNKKISKLWRLKQWPLGHFSTVVLEFEEKDDCTILKLKQTGVPKPEAESTLSNWKLYYFSSIKQKFGFGSPLV